jgi:hypothetical protein
MIARLSFAEYLRRSGQSRLQNVHGTVTFNPDAIVRLEPGPNDDTRYEDSVQDICQVVGQAVAAGRRLRCLGRRWSVSPVATTDGWLLDLSDSASARWLGAGDLTPELAAGRDVAHLLVSGGASIRWLNWMLHRAGWSLQTSGASNGQSVAGAIATGTHGSSFHIGALHDTVAAIHVVVSPTEHWWVEPETRPTTAPALAASLGAKPVRNDELFGALQTSLGSLGVIAGVVLRCVRNFWLRLERYSVPDGTLPVGRLDLARLTDLLAGWRFGELVGQPQDRIRHLDVVFNPYMPEKQCYVSAYVLADAPPGGPGAEVTGEYRGSEWSPDVLQFVGRLAGAFPGAAGAATQVGLKTEYDKQVGDEPRVWGAWFTGQDIPPGALALSYGVDCRQLPLALETVLQTVQARGRVPCVVATRFVPKSSALLAMNRYPRTCMIDVDGANVPAMGELLAECSGALEAAGVPFTLHWGKSIDYLNREYVERVYETDLTRWRTARRELLPDPVLSHTFSNDVVDALL